MQRHSCSYDHATVEQARAAVVRVLDAKLQRQALSTAESAARTAAAGGIGQAVAGAGNWGGDVELAVLANLCDATFLVFEEVHGFAAVEVGGGRFAVALVNYNNVHFELLIPR